MKKIFFLNFLLILNTGFSAQTLQVNTQLSQDSDSAALLLVIYDLDQGKKTPYFMNLSPGKALQTFSIEGDHFQILQWEIQAPHLKFSPCAPSDVINHHSLIVSLYGKIEAQGLHCTSHEVAMLPQLATPTPTVSSSPQTAHAVDSDPNAGNKAIANYLTALSKNCQKGKFIADFEAETVTYNILGMKEGHCDVSIGTNQLPPVQCAFNQNDIALLASPTEIESYRSGTSQYSDNSLSARIMKARCKAAEKIK